MAWTQRLRHLIQFAFGAFIIITSLIVVLVASFFVEGDWACGSDVNVETLG